VSARSMRRSHERAERRRRRIVKRAGIAAGAAVGVAAVTAAGADAATFTVTNTNDAGAGSLRAAVSSANGDPAADTITFSGAGASGTIRLTSGQIDIQEDLTITGPGAGALTITGDADDSNSPNAGDSRIFFTVPPGSTPPFRQVTITGLTLTEGFANSTPYDPGGAIAASGTDLTLDHVAINDNVANGRAGGVLQQSGSLEMTNSTVTGNRGSDAGGMFTSSYSGYGGSDVSNTTFTDNHAGDLAPAGPYGFPRAGALNVVGGGTLDGLTVSGNTATETFPAYTPTGFGGGIVFNSNGSDSAAVLRNSVITGNSAAGGAGGLGAQGAVVEATTISDNQADYGGGMYSEGSTLRNSAVSGNTARTGGGVYAGGTATTTLRNSTISGNQATGGGTSDYTGLGGGVFVYTDSKYASSGPSEVRVRATTVAGNSAAVGGAGMYAYREDAEDVPDPFLTLRGTIVADNAGPGGELGQNVPGAISGGFSLVESPGAVPLAGDPSGTNITGVDPKLGPLSNNGGPTQTMALDPTSAAIDASQAFGLTTDQRGSARPIDSAATNAPLSDGTDIGAFEVSATGAPGDDDITPPTTKIKKAPKKLKLKAGKETRKAKLKFTGADDRGAVSFECKLDKGKFEPCKSPLKLKLDKGKHVVEVRAVDAAGNADPSPAKAKIKVKRAKPKK
jgi:hypothetical protein